MDLKYEPADHQLREKLREKELDVLSKTIDLAEAVAMEVINHARSKKNGKHPGNWQDITSNLANSLRYTIETNGLEVRAIVEATMDYAAALDAKTGYSVFGGVEKVAQKAIKKHAPKIFDL